MKTVKVALIGLGFMGSTHFRIHQSMPGVQVVAVADLDPVKRTGDIHTVVGNIGGGDNSKPLDFTGVTAYADPLEMIAKTDADMIDICVPTPDHAKYIIAALKAGKHVFSEKPLCRTTEELKEIAAAARSAKGYLNIGLCIRMWPEYAHAREVLLSGKAGKLQLAHFRRLSPSIAGNSWQNWYLDGKRSGGAILDLHTHDTDAVCHFFGKPKSVTSFGKSDIICKGGIDQVLTRYNYDNCDALITAEGGWCADKKVTFEMSFQFVCEKATIKLDASGYHIYWADGKVDTPFPTVPELPTGWHRELKYFTDCVRDGVKPEKHQTLQSVFDSYQVVAAEMESVKSNKTVEVQYV